MNLDLIAPEVIQRLAGSLLHFVWQGAVIALLTAVGLRLLRHRSAEAVIVDPREKSGAAGIDVSTNPGGSAR